MVTLVRSRIFFVLVFVAALSFARNAAAQTPAFEVSGGYQYLLDVADSNSIIQYSNGLFVSADAHLWGPLGAVGEFSRSANTQPVGESARFAPVDREAYSTMGGVHVGSGGVFLRALAGQIALRSQKDVFNGHLETTRTEMGWQIGVGLNFRIAGPVRGRVLVDYRQLFSSTEKSFGRQVRSAVGIVVGFGGR